MEYNVPGFKRSSFKRRGPLMEAGSFAGVRRARPVRERVRAGLRSALGGAPAIVLGMAGRRSPSVLLSLRSSLRSSLSPCIYICIYVYVYLCKTLPIAPCPARTRSLTGRAPRAPSKDAVSIKGPRLLKALLLNPGPFYSRGPPREEGPRKEGRAWTEQNRANPPPEGNEERVEDKGERKDGKTGA